MMKNFLILSVCIILGHELLELVAFSDPSLTLAFLGIGGGKKQRKAGKKAKKIFTESTEEGINMFNDMYEDDYGLIQQGIGNFSQVADEINKEATTPYLNTTEGKSFSNQIEENTDRSRRRFSDAASQLNLSDEAVVAGMNNINLSEGNSYRGLVSNATSRQNQLRGQKLSALAQILSGRGNLLGQKMGASNQGMNYGSGASGAYNLGFGREQQRQAANTQAFADLAGDVFSTFAGAPSS